MLAVLLADASLEAVEESVGHAAQEEVEHRALVVAVRLGPEVASFPVAVEEVAQAALYR